MTCPKCGSENIVASTECFNCGHVMVTTTAVRKGSIIASRYEILDMLGRGGMGVVYKAHDRTLDEQVALKVLRPDIANAADMEKRFRSEIKLARKIRHRNVCGIHEYGEDGDLRFIAMEFIDGVDLRNIIEKRGAPVPEEAFEICIQVCEGLHAIHDAGVIHRDLKTPNIMRDSKGYVRLMDFGIAKQAGESAGLGTTMMGMIVGTPEYMSPEQARGERIDFRSDVYAAGIVTYEVFTGKVPFHGETPMATIMQLLQQPPPLYETSVLPGALVPVLERALAKNAQDRYQTIEDMGEALKAARFEALPHTRRGSAPRTFTGAAAPRMDVTPTPARMTPTPMPSRVPTGVQPGVRPRTPPPAVRGGTPLPGFGVLPTPAPLRPTPTPERGERERVAALKAACDRIEGALARQDADEAAAVLAEAVTRLGDVEPLPTFAARIEETRRRQADRQRVAEVAARVETLLGRGDLNGARDALADAQRSHGAAEPLALLASRLAEAQQQAREAEVRQLLLRAESALASDRYEQAQASAQEALRFDPGNARAQKYLAEAQAELHRRAAEAQGLASSAAAIDTMLSRGDVDGAASALAHAQRTYGHAGPLPALAVRLQEAASTRAHEAQLHASLGRAEAMLSTQRLPEAEQAAEETLHIDPGNVRARAVLSAVEEQRRRATEEQRRAAALAGSLAEIESLLQSSSLEKAQSQIESVERTHGGVPALKELRRRLGDLEKQRKRDAAAAAKATEKVTAKAVAEKAAAEKAAAEKAVAERAAAQKALAQKAAAEKAAADKAAADKAAAQKAAAQKAAAPKAVAQKAATETAARESAKKATRADLEATTVMSTPSLAAAGPQRAPARSSAAKYAVPAVVVALLIAGGLSWRVLRSRPVATTSPAAGDIPSPLPTVVAPTPPPGPVGTGAVLIDALPWGEVVAVVDDKGKEHPLGAERFTPLLLNLPPGDYTVTVKNPSARKPVSLALSVQPASLEKKLAVFRKVDARDYLKKAGL